MGRVGSGAACTSSATPSRSCPNRRRNWWRPRSARSSPSPSPPRRASSGVTSPTASAHATLSWPPCSTPPRPTGIGVSGLPPRALAPDLEQQSPGAAQPGGQAPHRRGRHLSQRRRHLAAGGHGAGRAARRVAGGPPLLQRRLPCQAGAPAIHGTEYGTGGGRASSPGAGGKLTRAAGATWPRLPTGDGNHHFPHVPGHILHHPRWWPAQSGHAYLLKT